MALVLVVAAAASGCGHTSSSGGTAENLAPKLSFSFLRIGEAGEMDQTLAIISRADVAVTLTARLEALDAAGHLLSGVRVGSVYGTERGRQVLMPGDNLDVLTFAGPRATAVRDVRVSGARATGTKVRPATTPLEARAVNGAGDAVAVRSVAYGVQVSNENDTNLRAQVVLIIWSRPGRGESQQALRVLKIGRPTTAPAHGQSLVSPTAEQIDTISRFGPTNAESIKVYVTP